MSASVVLIFYGSILFCVIASIVRIAKFARAPVHLRWEFYRGSSVYEFSDWWNKAHMGFLEKLKSVVMDIFFLRDYFKRNRELWYVLYLFHLGIYLLILWHVWLFVVPLIIDIKTASIGGLVWGHVATGLAFIGGVGILIRRLTDEDLRLYYAPIHYVKWVVMILTILGGFYAVHYYFDASMPALLKYVKQQISFGDIEHKLHPPMATALHVLFASVWLVYLPFSHIMQIFFRYYHELRWDHVPNVKGSNIEKRLKELLDQPVSWSGPHIQTGKKWSEVASEVRDTHGGET